jgi:hypothetical protein
MEFAMPVKSLLLVAAASTALALAAAPVQAFQMQPMPVNPDGSARYVDPDAPGTPAAKATDRSYSRYSSDGWYHDDGRYKQDRYIGAKPADDHSYWGSTMLENPQR